MHAQIIDATNNLQYIAVFSMSFYCFL